MNPSVYMALFRARGSFGSSESLFFGCLRLQISSSGWWRKRKKKWENHKMTEITDSATQKSSYTPWLQCLVGGHSCESAWPGLGSVDHMPICTHGRKHLGKQRHEKTHRKKHKVGWKYSCTPSTMVQTPMTPDYLNHIVESYDSPILILFLPNATNVRNRISLYRLL